MAPRACVLLPASLRRRRHSTPWSRRCAPCVCRSAQGALGTGSPSSTPCAPRAPTSSCSERARTGRMSTTLRGAPSHAVSSPSSGFQVGARHHARHPVARSAQPLCAAHCAPKAHPVPLFPGPLQLFASRPTGRARRACRRSWRRRAHRRRRRPSTPSPASSRGFRRGCGVTCVPPEPLVCGNA